ncbi:MAG: M13 family metallopeptidase [Bacteroidota bacterium]
MSKLKTLLAVAIVVSLVACNNDKNSNETDLVGLDLTNIDSTIKPTNDFYDFFSKKWIDKTEIPGEERVWGPLIEMRNRNTEALHTILKSAMADASAKAGSNRKKLGDFFASGMDSVKINATGFSPLVNEWKKTEALKDKKELTKRIAELNRMGASNTFGFYVGQDEKKSDEMIVTLYQGGISLPSKEYYDANSGEMKAIQVEFKKYIAKILTLAGVEEKKANEQAEIIYAFEKKMADASMTNVEMRDPEKMYNKKSLSELQKLYPNIDWKIYFEEYKTPTFDSLIVGQLNYFSTLDKLIISTPLDTWKTYLNWKLANETSPFLSDDFANANFEFYDKTLMGSKSKKPRWKSVIDMIDGSMGDAIGEAFVEKHFSPNAKKKINEMVDNIMAVYQERISQLDWMSAPTKEQAKKKLAAMDRKLGYPDKWKDYSTLEISRDSYVQNIMNSVIFGTDEMVNKLGKPVDRTEWGMSAPTVNAYYNPSKNEIAFPAGIMQAPAFDENAPDFVNYASIGAVIGHELTHGFDDQGSQYDEKGNLKNWWTEEDKAKFNAKTKLLVEQYNAFVAVDTFHVNGELTLGENIADLGGLTIAYYAWKKSLNGKTPEMIKGYTQDQLFFMSFAQVWRMKMRDESMKNMVITNSHSPSKFRVIGPLSNMKEFYDAWGAKQGDKMFIEENKRALIW